MPNFLAFGKLKIGSLALAIFSGKYLPDNFRTRF